MRPFPALSLIALALVAATSFAGPSDNVIFHSNLDEHSTYNDIWGYTAPNGDEYALLGTTTGMAVINILDLANPYETAFFSGPTSTWRDIKTYGHYAYVTNESNSGIQIIDLDDPENPTQVGFYTGGGMNAAHNLFIDTDTGILYTAGANIGSGGTVLLDLTGNPEAPVEINRWTNTYFHDIMVQDGVAYGSAINDPALVVLNVSNPLSISTLGTAESYPQPFTHNAWVTEDNAYVMTTDETSSSSCRMWDLSTLPNLVQTDSYKPNAGTIPHNTHIDGDLAFVSFYTLGVKILDISNPNNLVEVGSWDTWPLNDGSSFDGCWGAFPFFDTRPDVFLLSDFSSGLWVLEYKGPLGTLAGTVTETGAPATMIAGAGIEILETARVTSTDGSGDYSIQDLAGNVNVEISAYGYSTKSVPATITTGVTTTLDVTLDPLPRGSISGTVTVSGAGTPIPGARLEVLSTPLVETSDGSGNYDHTAVPVGNYTVRAFAFGYRPAEASAMVSDGGTVTLDFELSVAFASIDFESGSLGWIESGPATTGNWEVANPQGTSSGGVPVQPEDDHTPTPGTDCFVTGASSGGSLGSWDVDGGATLLTSPTYALGGMADPHVYYWRWYSTGVGNSTTDYFVVEASTDGGGTWPITLENTDQTTNAWIELDLRLNDYFTPSNLTKFRFTAQDTGSGSIIEAALDDFMIYDGTDDLTDTSAPLVASGVERLRLGLGRPNPFRLGQETRVDFALPKTGDVSAVIYDVTGRRVVTLVNGRLDAGSHSLLWDGRSDSGRVAPAGVYFLRVESDGDRRSQKMLYLR